MDELDETQETILAECLEAIDAGADIEACLARYPQHAQALRPYLELRAQMLALERPEPSAAAYEAGRQALLGRLAQSPSPAASLPLVHAAWRRWGMLRERVRAFAVGGWNRLESPLARVAAVGALLFLVGGGALGASAAGGFQPAREVLSALRIPYQSSDREGGEERTTNDDEGADNADDGIGNAPDEADTGRGYADERADEGAGNANDVEEPEDFVLPDDVDLPDDSGQPDDSEQPDPVDLPDDSGQPDPVDLPDDSGQPDDVELPDDSEQPDDSGLPDDVELPDDSGQPDDVELPDDSGLPDGVEQPDDSGLPDGVEQPDDVAEPDELPLPAP